MKKKHYTVHIQMYTVKQNNTYSALSFLSFSAQVLCKNFNVFSVNILASPICFFAHS